MFCQTWYKVATVKNLLLPLPTIRWKVTIQNISYGHYTSKNNFQDMVKPLILTIWCPDLQLSWSDLEAACLKSCLSNNELLPSTVSYFKRTHLKTCCVEATAMWKPIIASWDAAAVCNYSIQPIHITHPHIQSPLGITRNH